MAWRHTNSPVRVKSKWTISTRKVMATVFWDRHGVLLVEFMQQGTTINATAYCATLTKLRRAIQNKRRGLLTSGVLLLHDNARPHSAINTQNLIRSFGWEQIDHPPYSPDFSPSDFHLFRYLKEFLGGKHFDTADEVKEEVQDWLSSQASDVYDLGIQKLVERYDKCLNKYGNYTRAFGDGPRHFETWSSDEDDTSAGAPPLLTTAPQHGRTFELSTDLTCFAALHGGSLAVLGSNS
ncbi:histone-lysine N-methyltransferase SETMAR [Trichonephila clavipes]|nr:histone-lysine N-methyltransferase SETMAR [Trichonephila clavipes]